MKTMNNSYLLIDTGAIKNNAENIISSLHSGTRLIPVLKDDAYGLGLVPVAKALSTMPEIDMIAVAHFSEGLELTNAGIEKDILVMGNILSWQIRDAVMLGLTITAGRPDIVLQAESWAKKLGKRAKIHIKIDTGLHRIGFAPGKELTGLIAELGHTENIEITGVFSHFGDLSDEKRTGEQFKSFLSAVNQLESACIHVPLRHISGSEAMEHFPQYNLDAVRVGRRLYMDNPEKPLGGIKEASSWRTYITNIHGRKAGDNLGYGGRVTLKKDTVVATVGIGYGDGFSSAWAENGASVLVSGKLCPVLACCMDQSFIDVTGVSCKPDDEVTIFGYDEEGNYISIQALAAQIGANEGCGITSSLSKRVDRLYI